jgi:hypothetical protein
VGGAKRQQGPPTLTSDRHSIVMMETAMSSHVDGRHRHNATTTVMDDDDVVLHVGCIAAEANNNQIIPSDACAGDERQATAGYQQRPTTLS